MGKATPNSIISHWSHMLPGLNQSSDVFYQEVEGRVTAEALREIKVERVILSEGGIFSNKREYLQVRRGEHVFHICAAPYGQNYFLSYWLGEIESGFWAWISDIPFVGWIASRFLKPVTYFKLDTAGIFQALIHGAIMETLDDWTKTKGIKALSPDERKPIMRDFFDQLKG
jgi:hypothetical protein